MPKIEIDGRTVEAAEGATVLKAAESVGVAIPHFCYHPAFAPEGSCRMCAVEVEGSPKLELACSMVVREGLKVRTASPAVREARRSVLEFFLADHPIDCPICDKAGECRLQDYYFEYGLTESRFAEAKERKDKKVKIGEKLILDRERCIQCTRCVRFLAEVTRTHELGVVERGVHSEIATFPGELVRSVDSGNLVDLCPVGAITDTDFRFKTRPWFLKRSDSICPLCSRGCNIVIDHHPGIPRVPDSRRIYRIRPRENAAVNGHFICDHGRYGFVALHRNGRRERIGWAPSAGADSAPPWEQALDFAAEKCLALRGAGKAGRIGVVLTSQMTNDELALARNVFVRGLGAGTVAFADPPDGPAAGILLHAERSPNRAGAAALGFDLRAADPDALAGGTDLLFVFGTNILAAHPFERIQAAFGPIRTKILLTAHETDLSRLADLILPVAAPAETSGSFTNADGIIQRFEAAVVPCGDTRSAADILAGLAARLGVKP